MVKEKFHILRITEMGQNVFAIKVESYSGSLVKDLPTIRPATNTIEKTKDKLNALIIWINKHSDAIIIGIIITVIGGLILWFMIGT